jgi:putative redox protein
MGGEGKVPNPIQYLIGSLGGCVGVKILMALSNNGIVPAELRIGIHATRVESMPSYFDHVHLTITIRAETDDAMLNGIIDQTLSRLCPIAAMVAECGSVTVEHHIIRT